MWFKKKEEEDSLDDVFASLKRMDRVFANTAELEMAFFGGLDLNLFMEKAEVDEKMARAYLEYKGGEYCHVGGQGEEVYAYLFKK